MSCSGRGRRMRRSLAAELSVLRTRGVTAWLALGILVAAIPTAADQTPDVRLRELLQAKAPDSLKEFRVPETADLTGDWALHPRSFLARGDFDGDSRKDTAVLLIRRAGSGF